MARTPVQQLGTVSLAARRVLVAVSEDEAITDRAARMARFAAGARRVIARAAAVGGLMAAGWLLAVLFGMLSAAPASAEASPASAETTADAQHVVSGSTVGHPRVGDFPTVGGKASASDNTEAMAGLTVDGLTSQSKPTLPVPSSAGKMLGGTNGLVPNGGGSGPFGPSAGDIARSLFDPRLEAQCAPLACLLPPVVRTAADDPSFSPD